MPEKGKFEVTARPAFVGREAEFKTLQTALADVRGGQGRTVFLAGEAGIGKTRLMDELRVTAKGQGVRVMSGTCFAENLTPYIAYAEAFRDGQLDFLFAEEAVRVEWVYLVDKGGLLLAKAERAESKIDPDIFTAMLQAVENFVKDSLSRGEEGGTLNALGFGEYRILIEQGKYVNLVSIVTGKENEFLVKDIQETLERVEADFGLKLEGWDGDMASVTGIEAPLNDLLASDKYEGLDPSTADPQVRRNRLFENIALGLVREAKRSPILLCLDDLQWADPSTLALTHYIARNAREASLLIVGTYRSEDLQPAAGQKHPLIETLQLMSRERLYEQIEVRRLEPGQVRAFVTGVLGQVEFPEDFDPGVFKESGGNPFYLLEIVRMTVAEGVLQQKAGVWRFTRPLTEVDIPPTIQNVIVRRLQRVPQAQRDLLDVAAVVGEAVNVDVLAKATGKERIPLMKELRPLGDEHQLLRPGEEGGYRFDHAKVREILYFELPEPLRREYHGVIGAAIEGLNTQAPDAVLADLAYHFYQARNRTKGVQYSVRAGDAARQLYANAEGIRFFSQALELIGADPKWREQKLMLAEAVGDLQDTAGQFDGALQSYADVLAVGPDAESRARMHRKRGSILVRRGMYDKAHDELGLAETSLAERNPEQGRVRLWRGRLEYRRGKYTEAASLLTDAAHIFEETGGDEIDEAEAFDGLAFVHWFRQEATEARKYWEESIRRRRDMDDQKGLRAATNNLANTWAADRDYENALKYYNESLRIAEKIGDAAGATKPLINIGRTQLALGRRQEAHQAFQRALKTSLKVGDQHTIASVNLNLAYLEDAVGELEKAQDHFRRALEIADRIGERLLVAGAHGGLASVAVKRGARDEGAQGFSRALEMFRAVNVPDDVVYSATALGWVRLEEGDVDDAAKRLAEAESMPPGGIKAHVDGAILALRGAIQVRRGGDGEALLRQALATLPDNAFFELIRVKRELGALLKAKGDPQGASLIADARDLAKKTGDAAAEAALEKLA